MDGHLSEPCSLHLPVRDSWTGQTLLTETLGVDNVLSRLGCDVLTVLGGVTGQQLQENIETLSELRGSGNTHGKTEIINLDDRVLSLHGEVVLGVQVVVAIRTLAEDVVPGGDLDVIVVSLPGGIGHLTGVAALGHLGSLLTVLRTQGG